jgi:hypothetical protein
MLPWVVVVGVLSGCGNAISASIIGVAAVGKDDRGIPVVLVDVCSEHIDRIEWYAGREGLADDAPNRRLGAWRATAPQTGTVALALADPSSSWITEAPLTAPAPATNIVDAAASDKDSEAMGVSFTAAQLDALPAGRVLVREGEVWTRERFDAQACSLLQ